MFERINNLCINSSHGCKKCALGDCTKDPGPKPWRKYDHKRCFGQGQWGAPVMLVGERPTDVGAYGVYNYLIAKKLSEPSKEHLVPRALQVYGIPADLIYGTTAVKCDYEDRIMPPKGHVYTCLENHLGVEIEAMEPAVIWITGWNSSLAIKKHFKLKERMPVGGVARIKAPKIWRFDEIMLIRTAHPNQWVDPRTWTVEVGNIVEMAAYISVYLSEVVFGQR